MTLRIGFVGLGTMGLPMIENLARAPEFDIQSYDRVSEPFEKLRGHPSWGTTLFRAQSLAELKDREIVITMLPDSNVTNAVVLGEPGQEGLLALLAAGSIVVDMGSSNPAETISLARRLGEAGITLIDAPVSGAVAKARTAELSIMVGGSEADLRRIRPVIERMGATITPTGEVGSAHAMKALNNYVYTAGLLAACESLLIAERMGLNSDVLVDVLNASSGHNFATETKLHQFILSRKFSGGFAMRLMAKDLATANSLQKLSGTQFPQLALCASLWSEAMGALDANADNTEIYKYLESRPRAASVT